MINLGKNHSLAFSLIMILCFLFLASPNPAMAEEPMNKIVVVLDSSGTFQSHISTAIDRVIGLLEDLKKTKLQRWESETDQITILALDAMPETVWSGSLAGLKAIDSAEWKGRFLARKDLAACTDVQKAFRLAAQTLAGGDPRYVSKYLLVFSDLINEPPTTSISTCRKAIPAPSADFPWESFEDVAVTIYWVSPDQKLIWTQAAEQHGLGANFSLYTTSQSAEEKLKPAPRPVEKISEQERGQQRERIIETGKGILGKIFCTLGVIILALLGLVISKKLLQGRSRQSAIRGQSLTGSQVPGKGRPGIPPLAGKVHPRVPRNSNRNR